MNRYRVEIDIRTFTTEVHARDEDEALNLACDRFDASDPLAGATFHVVCIYDAATEAELPAGEKPL